MTSRRDLLRSLLGAPFLLACGGVEKRPHVQGGWQDPDHALAHRLRKKSFDESSYSQLTPERIEVAIVGSGVAGSTAAWNLRKHNIECTVLELDRRIGGTSAAGSSPSPHPWGAHYIPLPMRHNTDLVSLLQEVGVVDGQGLGIEAFMVREPTERLFVNGHWYPGLYPYAGASDEDVKQLHRFRRLMWAYAKKVDAKGRRAFSIPLETSSRSLEWLKLDHITADEWLRDHQFTSERLRWFLEYGTRDDYGLTLKDCSAWALIFYRAARLNLEQREEQPFIAWPQGNGALVSHMLQGTTIQQGVLIQHVKQDESGVMLFGTDRAKGKRVFRARSCVMATPRFVTEKVVDGVNKIDADFQYGAWVVGNLTLSRRPQEIGFEGAWDSVIYQSPSLGYIDAQHQQGLHGRNVWTYYYPLTGFNSEERKALLAAKWDIWRDAIIADLSQAHPNVADVIERIDICRWGHGMIQPRPGIISSEARRKASHPLGQIHFAHTDLSGVALFEEAFFHGMRASREIIRQRSEATPT